MPCNLIKQKILLCYFVNVVSIHHQVSIFANKLGSKTWVWNLMDGIINTNKNAV